ncbi:Cytochrome P450 82A3 [Morella rubra]|uniref:Cytochrome P450 82A3 n=1 Tax=Morella rubra TaxID=262757 RepID=A0A6A1W5F0_9ROSI|nr:Cytochrome P450 82A3 [Morella rubra]
MLSLVVAYPITVQAAILILFLFLFFLPWISRRVQKPARQKALPPEAGGAWPVIGHLHHLAGSQSPHTTLGNMADKYGPLFTIWLGVHRTLVVSGWEIAKECFTTNDKAFATRPKALGIEVMAYNYAMFGFGPYGSYWRQVRKIITLEVLSSHRLEMFKHVWQSEINTFIKEIYQLWLKNNQVSVEMRRWFGDITLNVVLRLVVGKRFVRDVTNEENERNDRCRQAFREFFDLIGAFVVSDALPYLRWLDLGGYERTMKKIAKELDQAMGGWLQEHKQRNISGEVKGHSDFMDVMLSTGIVDDVTSSYDADTITKATCLTLIVASTDTTTVTLTWALCLLLNNPKTLQKAQEELDLHVGKERQVRESDVKNLVYLQAVLKETMRLYPAGPFLCRTSPLRIALWLATMSQQARSFSLIYRSFIETHMYGRIQNEFRPERFLTTHLDVDVRGQHFELIPFGSGRRSVPRNLVCATSYAPHTGYLIARL